MASTSLLIQGTPDDIRTLLPLAEFLCARSDDDANGVDCTGLPAAMVNLLSALDIGLANGTQALGDSDVPIGIHAKIAVYSGWGTSPRERVWLERLMTECNNLIASLAAYLDATHDDISPDEL